MVNHDELYEYILQHGGGTFDAYGRNLEDCKRYAIAVYPDFSYTASRLTVPIIELAFAQYRKVFDEPYNGGIGFITQQTSFGTLKPLFCVSIDT